jgi:hypothetical protein
MRPPSTNFVTIPGVPPKVTTASGRKLSPSSVTVTTASARPPLGWIELF